MHLQKGLFENEMKKKQTYRESFQKDIFADFLDSGFLTPLNWTLTPALMPIVKKSLEIFKVPIPENINLSKVESHCQKNDWKILILLFLTEWGFLLIFLVQRD